MNSWSKLEIWSRHGPGQFSLWCDICLLSWTIYLNSGNFQFHEKNNNFFSWNEININIKINNFYYFFREIHVKVNKQKIIEQGKQKNGLLIKLFHFYSDFDETWWSYNTRMCNSTYDYNFTKFHQNRNKNKKVL